MGRIFNGTMKTFLEFLKEVPVIGILRDIPEGAEESCVKTASQCGLKAIEVTMNTSAAEKIIGNLRNVANPLGIRVGAGTVRNERDLEKALSAGAEFIVSPNAVKNVIETCVSCRIPSIPGALSPTEVQNAYEWGATCVKIFPVENVGGASYIRALRGPFRDIPLLACGGVSAKNVADYLRSGCDLVAFGGSIFSAEQMQNGNWESIGEKLSLFIKNATSELYPKFQNQRTV